MIIDLGIWQNILLLVLMFYFIIITAYKNGVQKGKRKEAYDNYQKELEKSGNFFWCNGRRIPYAHKPSGVKE